MMMIMMMTTPKMMMTITMIMVMMIFIPTGLSCVFFFFIAILAGRITIRNSEFYKDDVKIFLSGANTAWVAYGYDFGTHQYQYRRQQYIHRLDMVKNAGGNSMSKLEEKVPNGL